MTNLRATDEAAIQAVLAASYDAWAAGDAAGMVRDYTEDATAILPGSVRDGREAIKASMAAAFAGPLRNTWTYNRQLGLRFLGSDAAVLVTESAILFAGQTEVPEEDKVHATWVLQKQDGRWFIAAYHNSPALA